MNHGVKVAKHGHNVKTASIGDLIFTSSFPVLKIKHMGTGSVTVPNGGTAPDDLVYTHSLGYIPKFAFLIQWYDLNLPGKQSDYRTAPFIDTELDGSNYFSADPYASTTELRISASLFDGLGGSVSLSYMYAIYYDPEDE